MSFFANIKKVSELLFIFSCLVAANRCEPEILDWHRTSAGGTAFNFAFGKGIGVGFDWMDFYSGNYLYSLDLTNWTTNHVILGNYDVVFGNDLFVAVGSQTSYVSSDAIHWDAYKMPQSTVHLSFGAGKFFCGTYGGLIMTSADGRTWNTTQVTNGYPSLNHSAYGRGTYLVTDYRRIFTSSDAVVWQEQGRLPNEVWQLNELTFANDQFVGLAYGEGSFLAEGLGAARDGGELIDPEDHWWANNLILLSRDGLDWRVIHSTTNGLLRSIAGGNGLFVVSGTRGTFLYSTDGEHWTEEQTPFHWRGVGFSNSRFVRSSMEFIEVSSPVLTLSAFSDHTLRIIGPSGTDVRLETSPGPGGPWKDFLETQLLDGQKIIPFSSASGAVFIRGSIPSVNP